MTYVQLSGQLARDVTSLHSDDAIIFRANNRVVQLVQDETHTKAMASSNDILQGSDRLTDLQEQQLIDNGWEPPHPPHYRYWTYRIPWPATTGDAGRFATAVTEAMRQILSENLDDIQCEARNLGTDEALTLATCKLFKSTRSNGA